MTDPFAKIDYNKKSLLAVFVELAKADNDIDDNEVDFIDDVRRKLGVSQEDLAEIWKNSESYPLNPPKSERHRMNILYQLLQLTKIDGVVTVEEEEFVHTVAFKLGINGQLTEDLLKIVKKYVTTEIDSDEMLHAIRKYLN